MAGSERMVMLSDGAQLWTSVTGTGPPVAFCHGGPGIWDYLEPLACLLADRFTVVRFDQRGCGRSDGSGPFTIAQAVDDVDQVRAALGIEQWRVLGHSWGAELALRYTARHPSRALAVMYIAGVGAGDGFLPAYVAERDRRLGPDLARLRDLSARVRTPAEERERCLLQWRPDFSPSSDAAAHAESLWSTRPPDAVINVDLYRQLWGDRATEDLIELAGAVTVPVTMLFGADDPRPWTAADPLYAALSDGRRIVLDRAGHAPWVERPQATRTVILDAMAP